MSLLPAPFYNMCTRRSLQKSLVSLRHDALSFLFLNEVRLKKRGESWGDGVVEQETPAC